MCVYEVELYLLGVKSEALVSRMGSRRNHRRTEERRRKRKDDGMMPLPQSRRTKTDASTRMRESRRRKRDEGDMRLAGKRLWFFVSTEKDVGSKAMVLPAYRKCVVRNCISEVEKIGKRNEAKPWKVLDNPVDYAHCFVSWVNGSVRETNPNVRDKDGLNVERKMSVLEMDGLLDFLTEADERLLGLSAFEMETCRGNLDMIRVKKNGEGPFQKVEYPIEEGDVVQLRDSVLVLAFILGCAMQRCIEPKNVRFCSMANLSTIAQKRKGYTRVIDILNREADCGFMAVSGLMEWLVPSLGEAEFETVHISQMASFHAIENCRNIDVYPPVRSILALLDKYDLSEALSAFTLPRARVVVLETWATTMEMALAGIEMDIQDRILVEAENGGEDTVVGFGNTWRWKKMKDNLMEWATSGLVAKARFRSGRHNGLVFLKRSLPAGDSVGSKWDGSTANVPSCPELLEFEPLIPLGYLREF